VGTRITENAAADDVFATVVFQYLPYFGIQADSLFIRESNVYSAGMIRALIKKVQYWTQNVVM